MKKLVSLLLFAVLAVGIYYFIERPISAKHYLIINGTTLEVEVVNTSYLRKKGLMGRHQLPSDKGMLFIFPAASRQSFWMKNTLIPLSIAFIRKNGSISAILDMEPDRWDGKLKSYGSEEKVSRALEVNQGWFQRHHINVGDVVHFSKSIRRLPIR